MKYNSIDKKIILILSLFVFVCFIYSNHFNNTFQFDDHHVIVNNISIQSLSNAKHFFTDASTISSLPSNQSYRPLTTLSLAIDYYFAGGLKPFWFHVSTFLWFLLQVFIMRYFYQALINRSYKSKYNFHISLLICAIYALHPVNAETINYISARSDSLSTCFVLLALSSYIKWPGLRKYGLHLLFFFIAILFKQTAIVYPALLTVYVILFEQKVSFTHLLSSKKIITLLKETYVTWVFTAFAMLFLLKMDSDSYTPGGPSTYYYLISQPFVIFHYFTSFFWPMQLSADTDWQVIHSINNSQFWVGISFIISLLFVAFKLSKHAITKPICFGLLWFLIALIPTSSIIPLAEILNDHRMFFPYVGLVLAIVYGTYLIIVELLANHINAKIIKTISLSIFIVVITSLSLLTIERNKVWHSSESLWQDVTIKSPRNGRGLMNYALSLMSKGDYIKAESYLLEAIKYRPFYSYIYTNLGILYSALKQPLNAEASFQKALKLGSNSHSAHFFYAKFLTSQKNKEQQAITHLTKSLQLSPRYIHARHLKMHLLSKTQQASELLKLVQETFKIDSQDKLSHLYYTNAMELFLHKSMTAYKDKHFNSCIQFAEQAIAIDPKSAIAYNNKCAALNELGQYQKASIACAKALKIQSNFTLAQSNLKLAQMKMEDKR